jgi:hypothetical protein
MRFHPRKIVFDAIGVMWGIYFLWQKNWQAALVFLLVTEGLGLFFTRNMDTGLMYQTTLGKFALLHNHPINLALIAIGFILLLYGVWGHVGETIIIALSVIIMGHFFGWSEVNSKLRMI